MTSSVDTRPAAGSLAELYDQLAERAYAPLWTMKNALTPEPDTRMTPRIWRYAEARDLIVQAGELISVEEADRRVLAFVNPGRADHEIARATDTLWAAVQMVLPCEAAPPHRHTAAALRFVIEGRGAYTVVDGARIDMEPGDFLLTPNWAWHEHAHDGGEPMIWLDGLDSPMVHTLRLMFAEFSGAPAAQQDRRPAPALETGRLAPSWTDRPAPRPMVWKLAEVEQALDALRDEPGSPYDDLILEYRNPDGSSVMPTMAAYLQMLRPGVTTAAHRQSSSAVYHAVRGNGFSVVDGERFDWTAGDTFCVPVWAAHHHGNAGDEPALLFSYTDEPAVRGLGLYREQDA